MQLLPFVSVVLTLIAAVMELLTSSQNLKTQKGEFQCYKRNQFAQPIAEPAFVSGVLSIFALGVADESSDAAIDQTIM